VAMGFNSTLIPGLMKPSVHTTPKSNAKNLSHDPFTSAVRRHHMRAKKAAIKPEDGDDYPDYNDQNQYDDSNDGSNWDGSGSDDGDGQDSWVCYCEWCDYISYDGTIAYLQETTYDFWDSYAGWYYGYAEDRIWLWQTCTTWGYQISTDYGRNIFEDSLPINYLIDFCPDVFGDAYNRSRLDGGVRDTNWRYGGQDNYNGTNVVLVNGSEDPWHVLGIYGSQHKPLQGDNGNVTVMYIPGTSHCQDMMKWEPGDVDVVKVAHAKLRAILEAWVKQSKPSDDN